MSRLTSKEELEVRVAQLYENAKSCGKEGAGMHRNHGDSGRVAALWAEAKKELEELIAKEGENS